MILSLTSAARREDLRLSRVGGGASETSGGAASRASGDAPQGQRGFVPANEALAWRRKSPLCTGESPASLSFHMTDVYYAGFAFTGPAARVARTRI
jgi:hypothetical protein